MAGSFVAYCSENVLLEYYVFLFSRQQSLHIRVLYPCAFITLKKETKEYGLESF